MNRWRVALVLLPLGACTQDYPMDRPGTWSPPPVGSNDANLRAMVVRPRDLIAGTGERNSTGAEAARPVRRLIAGKREPLPASGVAAFTIQAPPSAPGGGDGAAAQ